MTGRIAIAGLLGAIAMFVWSSIAHIATPLARPAFATSRNEAAVLSSLESGIGQDGLYLFPGIDMKAPDAMQNYAALLTVHGSGLLVFHPAGPASLTWAPDGRGIPQAAGDRPDRRLAGVDRRGGAAFGRRVLVVSAIGRRHGADDERLLSALVRLSA